MGIKDYKELLQSSELHNAIRADQVCLFLGAGVANNLGMPNWNGLARMIAQYCTKKGIFRHSFEHTLLQINDPLKIISYCCKEIEQKSKQNDFKSFLNNIFIDQPNKKYQTDSSEIYKNLIEICNSRKALIVQTNYDDIIETHLQNPIERIIPYRIPQISKISNDMIVYLHGKCVKGDYENWVFNRQQYNDVYVLERNEHFEKQKAFLKLLLQNYHIIVLGYSLQDAEILQLIANRPKVEGYKKINVIIDSCDAKKFSNEIDVCYWRECCEGKIDIYSYSTEEMGFLAFEDVITNIKDTICKSIDTDNILIYTDPSKLKDCE